MRDKSNLVCLFIPDRVIVSEEHSSQKPLLRSKLGESNQTSAWYSYINLQNIVGWSNLKELVINIQKDTFVESNVTAGEYKIAGDLIIDVFHQCLNKFNPKALRNICKRGASVYDSLVHC